MINTPRDAARQILEMMQATYAKPLEYAPAVAADFTHLDLPAYGATQAWMKNQGFRRLADLEVPAFSNSPTTLVARTFTRAFASADGATVAEYYQVKPRLGRLAGKWLTGMFNFRWFAATRMALNTLRTRYCTSFETEFDDGVMLISSNAQAAAMISNPPSIDVRFHPYGTAPALLLAEHTARVQARLAATPGARVVAVGNIRQLQAMQGRQWAQKSAWRAAKDWISKAEVAAMASNPEVADAVYAELQQLQRERTPR
jgi:hypothetical protein